MTEKYMFIMAMLSCQGGSGGLPALQHLPTTRLPLQKHQHLLTKYSHSTIYIVTKCSIQGKSFVLLNYNYIKAFRIQ